MFSGELLICIEAGVKIGSASRCWQLYFPMPSASLGIMDSSVYGVPTLLGRALPWLGICTGDCASQKTWSQRSSQKRSALSSFENLAQTMLSTDDVMGQLEQGKVPPHLEVEKRVLSGTLPGTETPDPADPWEQMAPDQVQACRLCFQKLTGDSGSPPERLVHGART